MTTESTDQIGAAPAADDFATFEASLAVNDAAGDDQPGDEDDHGDDAAAQLDETPEAPKPKQTAKERIDELTAARRQAERDAQDARDEAAHWRAQAGQQNRGRPAQPAPHDATATAGAASDDGKPNPEDFADGVYDPAYVEALTDWKVETRLARDRQETAQAREVQDTRKAFDDRTAALFPAGEPEGLKVIKGLRSIDGNVALTKMDMDDGPKVADVLGTNLPELNRISALAPHKQVLELAKISTRLGGAPATPAPPANRASRAPEPPEGHARGSGGKFTVAADTNDFAAFERSVADPVLARR